MQVSEWQNTPQIHHNEKPIASFSRPWFGGVNMPMSRDKIWAMATLPPSVSQLIQLNSHYSHVNSFLPAYLSPLIHLSLLKTHGIAKTTHEPLAIATSFVCQHPWEMANDLVQSIFLSFHHHPAASFKRVQDVADHLQSTHLNFIMCNVFSFHLLWCGWTCLCRYIKVCKGINYMIKATCMYVYKRKTYNYVCMYTCI